MTYLERPKDNNLAIALIVGSFMVLTAIMFVVIDRHKQVDRDECHEQCAPNPGVLRDDRCFCERGLEAVLEERN